MQKPRIIGQSAFDVKQIEAQLKLGYDAIELQLNGVIPTKEELESVAKYPIIAVRTPQFSDIDTSCEMLVPELLQQYFAIANAIAELKNVPHLKLVLHTGLNSIQFRYHTVYNILQDLLQSHTHVVLSFENIAPIGFNDDRFRISDNYLWETADVVMCFCEDGFADKVETTLNVCHAQMSIQFVKYLKKFTGVRPIQRVTLEDFFKHTVGTIGSIRLAKAIDTGYGAGYCREFTTEDQELLRYVLNLHKEYCPDSSLVITTQESSNGSATFNMTKQLVNTCYEEV